MTFRNLLQNAFLFILIISANLSAFSSENGVSIKTDSTETIHTPWDKFSVSFGGFFANYNSGITIGIDQLGAGILINLENALDLEESAWALRGKINYRFGKTEKHRFSFGYFQLNRTAIKTLEKDFEIGNVVIPFGTNITSKFNFTILRAKYDYSFYQDKRVSLGASIGFFIMPVSFSVDVKGSSVSSMDMLAPLPVIGLRSDFLITKKLYYKQSLELLYLSYEGFTGSILDLDISTEYRPIPSLGFGLGINSTKMELSSTQQAYPNISFVGELASSYIGVYLFGKYIL